MIPKKGTHGRNTDIDKMWKSGDVKKINLWEIFRIRRSLRGGSLWHKRAGVTHSSHKHTQ